ncbi:MAG: LysR family transcriptional regulator [Clostridia bacterium]
MLENINLDYFKIFYEVATEKNLTKVSKKLLISQPAISQTIHKLEDELNATLFIRTTRGVVLTEVGNKIYFEIKNGLDHFKNALSVVDSFNSLNCGTLSISCGTNATKLLLSEKIARFKNRYPNVKIKIYDEVSSIASQKVKDGYIDFVITQPNDITKLSLESKLVTKLNYVFVAGNDFYKQSQRKIFSLSELSKLPIIANLTESNSRKILNNIFEKNNIAFEPAFEVSGHSLILDFVKKNLGVALIQDYIANDFFANGSIIKLNVDTQFESSEFRIAYNSFESLSQVAKAFLEFF